MTIGFRSDDFLKWGNGATLAVEYLRENILPTVAKFQDIAIIGGYPFNYHVMDWHIDTKRGHAFTVYAVVDDLFGELYEWQAQKKIILDTSRKRRSDCKSYFAKNINKLYYLSDGGELDEAFMNVAQRANRHLQIEVIRFGVTVEYFNVRRT